MGLLMGLPFQCTTKSKATAVGLRYKAPLSRKHPPKKKLHLYSSPRDNASVLYVSKKGSQSYHAACYCTTVAIILTALRGHHFVSAAPRVASTIRECFGIISPWEPYKA